MTGLGEAHKICFILVAVKMEKASLFLDAGVTSSSLGQSQMVSDTTQPGYQQVFRLLSRHISPPTSFFSSIITSFKSKAQ